MGSRMSDIIELAVKCNDCGQWNALTTSNLQKAILNCKQCGNKKQVRKVGGWNLQIKLNLQNKTLQEFVSDLNKTERYTKWHT